MTTDNPAIAIEAMEELLGLSLDGKCSSEWKVLGKTKLFVVTMQSTCDREQILEKAGRIGYPVLAAKGLTV